jgi:hypothetical protein
MLGTDCKGFLAKGLHPPETELAAVTLLLL